MNYYNEIDEKTAAWLRELIKQGHLPPGDVDTRSIIDVKPDDLKHYTQCHFFAGIGGWSLALALAGWSPDTPVWTGSCPCQPFSTAGKGLAQEDERHLWPVFFDLIRQCRPEHVFGEQVASAIGHGWLDGVSSDLEAEGYACGATVLGAHSVESPHQRQRLYWVAYAGHMRRGNWTIAEGSPCDAVARCSVRVDDAECAGLQRLGFGRGVDSSDGIRQRLGESAEASSNDCGLDDARRTGDERRRESGNMGCSTSEEQGEARQRGGDADSDSVQDDCGPVLPSSNGCRQGRSSAAPAGYGNPTDAAGFWSGYRLARCRDGKTRRIPTEPAFFPLAHGIPARVVRLRGYGNAIVPQVAAEFVSAYLEIL